MKHNQSTGWYGKRLLAALLCLLMLFALTGCESNSLVNIAARARKRAFGDGWIVERVYHYQFEGHDALNAKAGGTLQQAFSRTQIPDNGHVFIFITTSRARGNNAYFVLSDEKGNVVAHDDYNNVSGMYEAMEEHISLELSEVNELYQNGKISREMLTKRKQQIAAEAERNEKYGVQANIMSKYRFYAELSPVSASAEPNEWHELTKEQVAGLSKK